MNNNIQEDKYYTDYPFVELGDIPYVEAPIRECTINWYDGNKYCGVTVEGKYLEVKSGYIYKNKVRLGDNLTIKELTKYYNNE